MRGLAEFGVRKPVVANLVMFALIGAGIIFGVGLTREFFPKIDPTLVQVTVAYPGANPEEVEDALVIKMEDRISDFVDDVVEMNTSIAEGFATLTIEFREGVDIDRAVFDVKREMDGLEDLPEEAREITVEVFEPNLPTINVSIYGDVDERTMKDAALAMREDLRSLDGMGDITLSGVRTDEITVEVDPAKLLEHTLSLPDVSAAISAAMVELPGGAVRSGTGNIALRTLGAEEQADEVRDIVVKASGDGGVLRLRDIADVEYGFEDVDLRARLNGAPAVSLTVYKTGDDDAVEMAGFVKAYVAGLKGEPFEPTMLEKLVLGLSGAGGEDWSQMKPINERMRAWQLGLSRPPQPGTVAITTDLARFITGRLELLSRNAALGLVLVLATLLLLLNYRVAFWVALGLAVSVLGTLAAMELTGITLNMLTMFGLIIVLGLLVDDAIVVAENIVTRHEQGESPRDAAIHGTGQVTWPVIATVLTTICAFLPLALIAGQIGDLMEALPFVVSVSLGVSLIEAIFILPSHMAHSLEAGDDARARGKKPGLCSKANAAFERKRDAVLRDRIVPAYAWLLERSLKYRYITLSAAIAVLLVSFGMVGGGRVKFTFLPSADSETMSVDLRMPVGTPLDETDAAIRVIEWALTDPEQFPEITATFTQVGATSALDGAGDNTSTNLGQMILELAPIEARQDGGGRSSSDIRAEINRIGQELAGIESLRVEELSGGPSGADLSLGVVGPSGPTIERAAARVREAIAQFDGVLTVSDDNEAGRRELRLELRDGARELGFTVADIARQLRGWVFGLEAHTFAGDREDVDVRVMLEESTRRSLAGLESMHVFSPQGQPVPLSEVVRITEGRGYASIRRLDRNRLITVQADVDPAVTSAETIITDLRPLLRQIEAEIPGVRVLERGRLEEMRDSLSTLPLGLAVAAGLIYIILAWLFASFMQPLVVLAAVPFAIIGMVWGHFILGFDLTILSFIGFIALSGVVVNDSLILIEFYNLERSRGRDITEAALAAGRARFRAILLTTVTTVLGLLPLMLERSFQARFLIPMAITISCGLISATMLILLVEPCLLVIGRDLRRVGRLVWTGRTESGIDDERDGQDVASPARH